MKIFHCISSDYLLTTSVLIPRKARAEGPSVARLINLSGRVGPSGAKPREFERKVYLYMSLKVSALLPSNSEKQSMNDVRLSGSFFNFFFLSFYLFNFFFLLSFLFIYFFFFNITGHLWVK